MGFAEHRQSVRLEGLQDRTYRLDRYRGSNRSCLQSRVRVSWCTAPTRTATRNQLYLASSIRPSPVRARRVDAAARAAR